MKKILSILILAIAVLFLAGCSAEDDPTADTEASSDKDVNNADFVFEENADGTLELLRYNGQQTDVTVPGEYDGKTVSSIGAFAFEGRGDLTRVSLPDSVTEIKSCAFAGCVSLEQLVLPESAVPASKESFSDTPWYQGFGDGLVIVNGSVLEYKGYDDTVTVLEIPDGVKRIGERAFFGINIRSVKIPESVTAIGERAFGSCKSLMKISLPSTVSEIGYGAFNDTAWYNMQTGAVTIGNILVAYKRDGVTVDFPDNVKTVAGGAFLGSAAVVIRVPEGVESICDYAFTGCVNIVKIEIPSTVTHIGDRAFEICPTLKNINVSEGNAVYYSKDGELYDKAGDTLICSPESKDEADTQAADRVRE